MIVSITGISILAFIAWMGCMVMGEWKAALFAAGLIAGDMALNTYLEMRHQKKTKGQP